MLGIIPLDVKSVVAFVLDFLMPRRALLNTRVSVTKMITLLLAFCFTENSS